MGKPAVVDDIQVSRQKCQNTRQVKVLKEQSDLSETKC